MDGVPTLLPSNINQGLGRAGAWDAPINTRHTQAAQHHQNRPPQAIAEVFFASSTETLTAPTQKAPTPPLGAGNISKKPDADTLGRLAQQAARQGHFSQAHPYLARALRLSPMFFLSSHTSPFPNPSMARADTYAILGRWQALATGGYVSPEAEAAFRRAITLNPAHKEAQFYLGLMFFQTGRSDLTHRYWKPLANELPAQTDLNFWQRLLVAYYPLIAAQAGVQNTGAKPFVAIAS